MEKPTTCYKNAKFYDIRQIFDFTINFFRAFKINENKNVAENFKNFPDYRKHVLCYVEELVFDTKFINFFQALYINGSSIIAYLNQF